MALEVKNLHGVIRANMITPQSFIMSSEKVGWFQFIHLEGRRNCESELKKINKGPM